MNVIYQVDGLAIGSKVRKIKGYDWPGIIRSFTTVSTGVVTAAVESRLSPGTTHVFPPAALMLENRSDEEILGEVRNRFLTE
jgi:hypothetical protein